MRCRAEQPVCRHVRMHARVRVSMSAHKSHVRHRHPAGTCTDPRCCTHYAPHSPTRSYRTYAVAGRKLAPHSAHVQRQFASSARMYAGRWFLSTVVHASAPRCLGDNRCACGDPPNARAPHSPDPMMCLLVHLAGARAMCVTAVRQADTLQPPATCTAEVRGVRSVRAWVGGCL